MTGKPNMRDIGQLAPIAQREINMIVVTDSGNDTGMMNGTFHKNDSRTGRNLDGHISDSSQRDRVANNKCERIMTAWVRCEREEFACIRTEVAAWREGYSKIW